MSYRILKAKPYKSIIMIENTNTNATMMIGQISIKMLNILEKAGYSVTDDTLNLYGEWSFEINENTAKELAALSTAMEKPTRKPKTEQSNNKYLNKHIDATDVLLGLANYYN